MATITAAGTGSGLDIENIITTLAEAERVPTENRLNLREKEIEAEISAFGSLKSTMSDFQSALSDLSSTQKLAARAATTSNENAFTVTADSSAAIGSSNIQITQLASAHKMASNASYETPNSAVGAGTLNISSGGASFSVDITAGENNTLVDIRNAINDAEGNTGVTASILTVSDGSGGTQSKLVLSSNETGAANEITVSVTGDADGNDTDGTGLSALVSANMTQTSAAQDAVMMVDGFEVTSSTNEFRNSIQGVTINALKVTEPDTSETVSVSIDKTAIKENLAKMVESFNVLSDTIGFLTDYNAAENEAGLLTGDSTVRAIENQIRRTLTDAVDVAEGGFGSLASIGITTQRDGKLGIDDAKLDEALSQNFDQVADLLGGEDGIAKRLDDRLNDYLKTGGLLSGRSDTAQEQLKSIEEQRSQLTLRIASFEERTREKFSAMDAIVAQLNNTGDFLTQQLSSIANITKKD